MLQTSQTTFWYVLSGAIGLITIFLLWWLYYVIRLTKNAVYTVEKFTHVMKKMDEVLDLAKDKLNTGGTYVALIANAVKSVMEMVGERKSKSGGRKKK